jgi:hypothetical protein
MSDVSSPMSDLRSSGKAENDIIETTEGQDDLVDSDDDIQTKRSRKHAAPIEEDDDDDVAMGDDDLFGDGSDNEEKQ